MGDVLDDFVDENNASRTLAPAAVLSQVLLMSGVSLITIFVFNILRPRNKIVYEPKVKYHVGDKQPPRISDGTFGWLPPLIHTKEPVLLDKVGLDAVAFLRFLRMLRWMFTILALGACGILLPINLVYNLKKVDSKDRDVLSMLTLRDLTGPILFVHVAATYIFTFIVLAFCWINWKKMIQLRLTWFRSPEYINSFYARTLMIQKAPKKYQSDEGIRSILETVQVPYPATSVHIGRRVGRLPELIEFHNQAVRELEQVLVTYLKGGKIGKKRPTVTRGGFLGIGGKKYDAIDFYTNKVKRCEAAIENYREEIDTRKPENYGFASMAAVPYAHIVARFLENKNPRGTTVSLAPNPKDIIWENLSKSEATLHSKRLIGWIYLFVVCSLNTVPLLVVSFLANLASLTAYVGFLESWSKNSHITFTLISGILPPAVGAFFGWFLPVIMRWLSRFQGAITRSYLDRAVVARYFAFLIISQLFIFTLIGVIFNSIKEIVSSGVSVKDVLKNLNELPGTINRTYIDQANYWLTFFPLRGFLAVFDLAQVLHLVLIWIKTWIFGRTPRDIREWTQPPDFEYAIYYSNILFMCAVGFVFSPLAPLVPLAAAIIFWINSFVYKYQLMFVFVTKVESGGRLWNVVINRLLWCVVLMQLLMVLTIGLQEGWKTFQWVSTIPPILFVFAFKIYTKRVFLPQFQYYVPSEDEIRQAQIHRSDERGGKLAKRFGHPALHAELFTPLLHARMLPLLPQVYKGKIDNESMRVQDLGGQKTLASVLPDGIKIAAVSQNELEYDPALYQRDRGELDWDQRSISSTNLLSDTSTLNYQKSQFYPSSTASRGPAGYEKYLANGPNPSEIELASMDSRLGRNSPIDKLPLLAHDQQQQIQMQMQQQQQYRLSTPSLSNIRPPGVPLSTNTSPNTTYAPQGAYFDGVPRGQMGGTPPPRYPPPQAGSGRNSPASLGYPQQAPSTMYAQRGMGPPATDSSPNMAGRGAHRT